MKLTWAVSIGIGIVGMSMRPARACSPDSCDPAFVPGDGAVVPANLPAILWNTEHETTSPDPTMVTLVDAADPAMPIPLQGTSVAGGYALVPATPLVPGHRYTLTDATPCNDTSHAVTFTTTDAAPLPTTLGTLAASTPRAATINVGWACEIDSTPGVYTDLDVALAPEAAPWRDVLLYTTRVDGLSWRQPSVSMSLGAPGASWLGRGEDRVYARCGEPPSSFDVPIGSGAGEGTHRVTFDATLAGTSLALASDPASVTLDCGDGCSVGAGAGPLTVLALLGLQRRRRS